jgi:hypothetical protein
MQNRTGTIRIGHFNERFTELQLLVDFEYLNYEERLQIELSYRNYKKVP